MPNAPRHGGKVLVSVLLGTFTVSLNNSALNLAVADLMAIFAASATEVGWVVTLFMITMASLLGLAPLTQATPVWMIGAWMGLRGLGHE
ncbi:hypothetical protein ACJ7V3_15185 [Halomonas elongata]|uniref:hypothetical protein n=1 Tax=Halomonas elongata TaxID=2746 RepID=UPI0038D4E439